MVSVLVLASAVFPVVSCGLWCLLVCIPCVCTVFLVCDLYHGVLLCVCGVRVFWIVPIRFLWRMSLFFVFVDLMGL